MWKTRLSSENLMWYLPNPSHHLQPARLSSDTFLDPESKPQNKYKHEGFTQKSMSVGFEPITLLWIPILLLQAPWIWESNSVVIDPTY